MHAEVKKILEDIKSIKIQGARNIAKAVLNAIKIEVAHSKSVKELMANIVEIRNILMQTRKTEPMARNLIEVSTRHLLSYASLSDKEAIKKLLEDSDKIIQELDKYYNKMLEYGAEHIPDGAVIITICHSSSVVGVLKKAKEMGKEINVINCETRPLFQGRITARELVNAGIKVTHIIDSEAAVFIKKCDSALVGADAIDVEGNLYNKVGTRMLAELCYNYNVSFHPISELLKYDPKTLFGKLEPIEYRSPDEIWQGYPDGIKILNPAFDYVPAELIKSYITEEGILHPHEIKHEFEKKYKL
ncbi:MAG: S-methyl-5-thioribose-1-phosphate isomerase [Candidatus Anstonellales archaeon]